MDNFVISANGNIVFATVKYAEAVEVFNRLTKDSEVKEMYLNRVKTISTIMKKFKPEIGVINVS